MKHSEVVLAAISALTDKLTKAVGELEAARDRIRQLEALVDTLKHRPVDQHIQDAYNAVCMQLAATQEELAIRMKQQETRGGIHG